MIYVLNFCTTLFKELCLLKFGTSKTLKHMTFQREMSSSSQISNNDKASGLLKAKGLLKANTTCFLCSSRLHPTYRCSITRLIRDKNIQIPLGFCPIHCDKISETCRDRSCGLFKTPQGKLIDLRCHHQDMHFLLCNKIPCYTISENYHKRKIIK